MLKHWRPTAIDRVMLLRSITIIGLLSSLFTSTRLWYAPDRLYPMVPLVPNASLPLTVQGVLFAVTILTLGYALIFSKYRTASIAAGLTALFILITQDYTRLQPWLFHYVLMLALLVATPALRTISALDGARFLIAGIYVWSGIQKINVQFFTEVFPWFTEPLWTPFGTPGAYTAAGLAIITPFFEVAIGIGLLSKQYRSWALGGAAIMLLVVLASLGPLGHNWNQVVWPWNVALFLSALVLFWRWQDSFNILWTRARKKLATLIILGLIWLYPLGSFFGLSEHYLSWSLYSGKVPEARLVGDSALLNTLAPNAVDHNLPFQRWSSYDLGVVPYPEMRVHEAVYRSVCSEISSDLDMVISEPLSGRERTYTCADL